jgi:hypothetical protein
MKKIEKGKLREDKFMKGFDEKQLDIGIKYQVTSVGEKEKPKTTTGTYLGFTTIGKCSGICIKLDKNHKSNQGKIRIIPSDIILKIDAISKGRKKKKK